MITNGLGSAAVATQTKSQVGLVLSNRFLPLRCKYVYFGGLMVRWVLLRLSHEQRQPSHRYNRRTLATLMVVEPMVVF